MNFYGKDGKTTVLNPDTKKKSKVRGTKKWMTKLNLLKYKSLIKMIGHTDTTVTLLQKNRDFSR